MGPNGTRVRIFTGVQGKGTSYLTLIYANILKGKRYESKKNDGDAC